MADFSVGLFNDSFPPCIDGVAYTVKNYADHLHRMGCPVTVVTPYYRDAQDNYPYEVFRYPSIPFGALLGYRVGVAIDPETILRLRNKNFDIMHIHAPFASSVLVNNINRSAGVPTVLTYHTKFDIDISKRVPTAPAKKVAMEFLRHNVNAVDEVWVVTSGCIEDLRRIGYEGECRVMENGTDFQPGRAPQAQIDALREEHHLSPDVPVFLFVGRMMWYKNIRLILDSLKMLHDGGLRFHAFFIGEGYDLPDIKEYAAECSLQSVTTFTGAIRDRERLRVYFSMTDLFLFPSTYDTCGIVVKEAAACDCPSLMIENSCASEGAVHNVSAFLCRENVQSCADAVCAAVSDRERLQRVGVQAGKDLYLSWEDAVARAYTRYEEILKKH